MIDKDFLKGLALEHEHNLLSRKEAHEFLKELMELCNSHGVLLRTTDQNLSLSKVFGEPKIKSKFKAVVRRDGMCVGAKIELV